MSVYHTPPFVDEISFYALLSSQTFSSEDLMSKIDIRDQVLPPDHLAFVQMSIAAGNPVAGDDLLLAIEQSIQQQLPETVRNIVRRAIIPAMKTRGRPTKFGVLHDLAVDKDDQRYAALLRYEKRKKERRLKSGKAAQKGDSPSILAYERLLRHMKDEFGPMSREALKNMHSAYRNGHFHSAENHVDSEDHDAEIDRLFPSVPES